ncbi:MAG: hypothetical protein AB7V26_11660 [Lysobacterales bacterium]
MSLSRVFVLVLSLSFAVAASAADKLTLADIVQRQQGIAKRLDANRAKDLNAEQIQAIREQQRQVFALVEGKDSLKQLSKKETRQLDKALEAITNLLTTGRAEPEECWQERSIGTRVGQRRCGKKADRQAADARAREWLERSSRL